MAGSNLFVRYIQTGQGQDVILLNGLGQHCESWQPQIEALEQAGFRVLAYDYRGHGQSGWRDEEIDIYTFARDLNDLTIRLEIKQAHLVALSLGSAVAQAFYHLYPEKVLSMVLAGAFSYFPEPQRSEALKARLEMLERGGMAEAGRVLAERSFTENAPRAMVEEVAKMLAGNHPQGYRASMITSIMSDSHEFLKDIKVPVLVMVGEGDLTTPPALGQYLHENIKGSTFEVIPNARHIVTMEQPEAFNEKMLAFLKNSTQT